MSIKSLDSYKRLWVRAFWHSQLDLKMDRLLVLFVELEAVIDYLYSVHLETDHPDYNIPARRIWAVGEVWAAMDALRNHLETMGGYVLTPRGYSSSSLLGKRPRPPTPPPPPPPSGGLVVPPRERLI